MRRMNVITVFNSDGSEVLVCRREKPPYQGCYNFVGGKLEPGEDGFSGAYRELFEETGISRDDILLTHVMDFTYYVEDTLMEVYTGRLRHPVALREEVNRLFWLDTNQDYTDTGKFAGCGNMGHIVSLIRMYENNGVL